MSAQSVMSVEIQRFSRKRKLIAIVRCSLLADALVAAFFELLTALKCPVWLGWVVGMVVPECAHWFALLALAFAAGAWLLRRGHPPRIAATWTIG